MSETKEIVLTVPEMSCQHCVHTVSTALNALEGVSNVNVDLPSTTVKLNYQPGQVERSQIIAALDAAGYSAQ
jgi:copper chaperone CopZ